MTVQTESDSLENSDEELLCRFCKLFGNSVRIRIVNLLHDTPQSFGSMLKHLKVNPKVLNENLILLSTYGLVSKSYPYGVYTLTSYGHLIGEAIEVFNQHIKRAIEALERRVVGFEESS